MNSFETKEVLQTVSPLGFNSRIGQFIADNIKNNRVLRGFAVTTTAAGVLLSGAGCSTNPEAGAAQAFPVASASPFESPSATPVTFVEA